MRALIIILLDLSKIYTTPHPFFQELTAESERLDQHNLKPLPRSYPPW